MPKLVGVVGGKHSGKTTVIQCLISELRRRGCRVGSVKSGSIINYGNYTGVKLSDLCNLVGGITSSNTITVKGSDGYTHAFTYDQVANGNSTNTSTYDSSGNSATATNPLYLILAYWYNGTNIPTGSGSGPLKTMVVGADGLNTSGNVAVKWVVEIDIS